MTTFLSCVVVYCHHKPDRYSILRALLCHPESVEGWCSKPNFSVFIITRIGLNN